MTLGTIGFYLFKFIRGSRSCSLLTVGGTLLPQLPSTGSGIQETWVAWLSVKTEAKNLLGTSAFSMSVVTGLPLFIREGTLSLPFIFWPMHL